jgi:hypothetical protein
MAIGITRPIKNWHLWTAVYLVNFMFAALLTLPFAGILSKDISTSLVGRDLMGGLNLRWYTSFLQANGQILNFLLPQMVFVFAIYMVMEIFFAGGFYSSFSRKGKVRLGTFLSDGAAHFFPLLFVAIVEIAVLFLFIEGIGAQLSDAVHQTIAVLIFGAVCFFSDFVKAAIVIDDDGFWRKMQRGLTFIVQHPFSTVGVYLFCLLINVVIVFLYFVFQLVNDSTSVTGVLIEIIFTQIFVLLRIFSRLIFYGSEAALYKENQIEVIKVKPEMLE